MLSFTQNMRTLREEAELEKYLLSVGDGTLNDKINNLVAPEQCAADKNDNIF